MDVYKVIGEAQDTLRDAQTAEGTEATIFYVGQAITILLAALLKEVSELREDIRMK